MVSLRWYGPSDPRGGRVLGDLEGGARSPRVPLAGGAAGGPSGSWDGLIEIERGGAGGDSVERGY
jgi:hypothetical protein